MENTPKTGFTRLFGGKGFYIALALVLLAAGTIGYVTLFPTEAPAEEDNDPTLPVQQTVTPTLPEVDDEPITPPEHDVPVMEPEEVTLPETDPEPEAPIVIVKPLEGEVVAAFSATELTYDPTMEDWRVHSGIDIAAEEGASVLAACGGTVLSVTEDALMGVTVVIEGEDGCVATYANLQTSPPVLAGDSVTAGSVIGAVGTTSKAESATGPHLHFSVTRGGEPIDPGSYLS